MDAITLFGRRVRSLRRARGLTQEQLGEKAGLASKYIGSIERGAVNKELEVNPSLLVIEKLSRGLDVQVRDLFEIEHEETSQQVLRRKVDALMRRASTPQLQLAVKLLRALFV